MSVQTVAGAGRVTALLAPAAVGALTLATVGYLSAVDPNEPGHYPTCPFLALTGQLCPGCGALRAVHAMAHGDLAQAVGLNVLTVLAVVPLVVIWWRWTRRSWTGAPRTSVAPAPVLWGLLLAVCVFAVLRNVPLGSALAP